MGDGLKLSQKERFRSKTGSRVADHPDSRVDAEPSGKGGYEAGKIVDGDVLWSGSRVGAARALNPVRVRCLQKKN